MNYLNTDVPELTGYDTGTVLDNLALLEGRLEHVLETSLTELSELSEAILRDAEGDPDTVVSILLSLRGQPMEAGILPLRSRELLSQNTPVLSGMTRHIGLYERLVLYRLISARLPELPLFGSRALTSDDLPPTAKGRVAYMAGALADKAYIRFADHIPHCRAAVFHSYVDACEEVRGELCEYCLLPIESTFEGRLAGFSRLIIKYNLRIMAVCDIRGAGGMGEEITRFALLKVSAGDREVILSPLATEQLPATHLELLHTTENPAYSEVMAAAEFCGLDLERADTLPLGIAYALRLEDGSWEDSAQAVPLITTVWHTSKADLNAFLCYLSLEASEDPILGFYPSL